MSIVIENAVFPSQEQLNAVARGIRNPLNSWAKNDTPIMEIPNRQFGMNDYDLARRLAKAGDESRSHCKYLRMLPVIFDLTAPNFFFPEFDQYKIGVTTNGTSKMHRLMQKPFELSDFTIDDTVPSAWFEETVKQLNGVRKMYLDETDPDKKKVYWRYVLEMLPESYNQKRTVSLNYEVLHTQFWQRKDHKLIEWREYCEWIKTIPMADLIVGDKKDE